MDTSSYLLGFLRPDGRRWNDLRRMHARVSTHPAADGSSYLEIGNTKVICTVTGPVEEAVGSGLGGGGAGGVHRADVESGGPGGGIAGVAAASAAAAGGLSTGVAGAGGGAGNGNEMADFRVDVSFAAFSSMDRKRRGRMDKQILYLTHAVESAFRSTLLTHNFPRSTIGVSLQVLSQDGSVLAALVNATTLALVDAGVPMHDYVAAVTAGCMSASGARVVPGPGAALTPGDVAAAKEAADDGSDDPLLDMTLLEEQELPGITIATRAGGDGSSSEGSDGRVVTLLVTDSRFHVSRLEEMVAVGMDGSARVRDMLDQVVRQHAGGMNL